MNYERKKVTTTWLGLNVSGEAIRGDWEGDPSIPRGTRTIPPYVEDIEATTGEGYEITEYLTTDAIESIESALLEAAGEE